MMLRTEPQCGKGSLSYSRQRTQPISSESQGQRFWSAGWATGPSENLLKATGPYQQIPDTPLGAQRHQI